MILRPKAHRRLKLPIDRRPEVGAFLEARRRKPARPEVGAFLEARRRKPAPQAQAQTALAAALIAASRRRRGNVRRSKLEDAAR